MLPQIIGVI